MTNYGLPMMDVFPNLEIASIQGDSWNQVVSQPKSKIILFTAATCKPCQVLYPIVSGYANKNNVTVAMFMLGDLELIKQKLNENEVTIPAFHFTQDLMDVTKVSAFPYAYYLSPHGHVFSKGATPSEEHLDILLLEGRMQMEKIPSG